MGLLRSFVPMGLLYISLYLNRPPLFVFPAISEAGRWKWKRVGEFGRFKSNSPEEKRFKYSRELPEDLRKFVPLFLLFFNPLGSSWPTYGANVSMNIHYCSPQSRTLLRCLIITERFFFLTRSSYCRHRYLSKFRESGNKRG